jgi:mono/diheme cytochrome c family protein
MKKLIFLLSVAFALVFSSCNAHNLVANTKPFGTPIPTLAVATPPPSSGSGRSLAGKCQVAAIDLLAAWANAGYPEGAFDFTAANGAACAGDFTADVLPLFTESNLWYGGSVSCAACHGPDLNVSYAQLDVSSYAGVMAGSRRLAEAKPMVGGEWEKTKLYEVMVTTRFMPLNRPADMPEKGPLVAAGKPK